jgi:CelD/BcsL family acetyltransferase involved in cellulose biosynthesis
MSMRISLIQPAELRGAEFLAWHDMQRGTRSLMNPFLSPEFAMGVGKFRPGSRIAVLSEGPEILGFLPFERRGFGVGMPIGAGLSNCQGLVHVPALDWDARAVLRGCQVSAWQFDNLVQGQAPFERYAAAQVAAGAIDLADGFGAYYEKLTITSARFLKDLSRRTRTLEREFGEIRLVRDSPDPAALRMVMGWKSEQCRRNAWQDIFDRPWVVELTDYLFSCRSDLFSTSLSVLYAGETPVAGQFGLRCGGYFAGWFTAYDAGFHSYSPGLIQVMRLAEKLAEAGVEVIDMGGSAPYQSKLKSHDLYFGKGMVTSGRVTESLHGARRAAAAWAHRRIRRCPPAYRTATRVLRRSGRIA